jgi:indole-3-glycerol phosphate synthase
MDILEKIAEVKRQEVKKRRISAPVPVLEKSAFFSAERPSFHSAISKPHPTIIGEFKRKSPSKGIINAQADVVNVTSGYQAAGISAVSVLTDEQFFGGGNADLIRAASVLKIPILRKDFIVDEYQVIEARSIGASAILLIAAILTRQEVESFSKLANDLGMEILFEIHNESETEKLCDNIRIIGINNRDLRTFDTNLGNSARLFGYLPAGCLKVAESGISTPAEAKKLYDLGFDSFLIGENFMRSEDPARKAGKFIQELNSLAL